MPKKFPHYERLLNMYPETYRDTYGPQMIQTVADMLADSETRQQRWLIWTRVAVDFPLSVVKAQLLYEGGIMHNGTPGYVKKTGALTGILILPFFAALAANGLDTVINNHTLYNSWLWRLPVLGIWVLWLPATAIMVALLSYVVYTFKPVAMTRMGWSKRVVDVRRTWPLLIPGVLAFGILFTLAFHDSAHCWVQNPLHAASRLHQTWQCTRHGFLGG